MTAVPTGGEAARHRRGRLTRRSPLLYKYDRPAYGCPASLPGATAHRYAKGRSGPAFGRYPGSAAVWEDPPGGVPGNTRPRCSAAIPRTPGEGKYGSPIPGRSPSSYAEKASKLFFYTSCSICLSRLRSATSFFSCAFSSSSCHDGFDFDRSDYKTGWG